jgi:hydrogenase/urease accessory protein HupE
MQLELGAGEVNGVLVVNAADLRAGLGVQATDARAAAAIADKRAVEDYLVRHVRISSSGDGACSAALRGIASDAEHVRITIHWRCSSSSAPLTYSSSLFLDIDPASKQMVTLQGKPPRMALLSAASQQFVLGPGKTDVIAVFGRYLLAGIEHIAIGYDHIAFLIAVMLWARRLWTLVAVVSAFTVAHSITLTLAVLGVVAPPARLVEVLIALSVAYVAAENFFVHDLRRRWIITFSFGLVHGFGFAGVLREYGIPADALGWALAAFNIGVEVGQLVIVAAAFLLLTLGERLLRRGAAGPNVRLVYCVSGVVLLLGLYWSVERAFFA